MISVNISDRVGQKLRKLLVDTSDKELKAFHGALDRALRKPAVKLRVSHTNGKRTWRENEE